MREGAGGVQRQNAHLDELASYMLAKGDHLSSADALNAIRIWNQDHEAILSERPARTQMLSYRPQSLAGKSLLCEKRARIIELFDQLLAKLGGEELSANITMGKVSKEWHDALGAWLDSESQYRLTVEQVKDARKVLILSRCFLCALARKSTFSSSTPPFSHQGAQFSRDEYEKWKTAYERAKEDLEATLARHAEERKNLLDERELIREIMRYIGVLHGSACLLPSCPTVGYAVSSIYHVVATGLEAAEKPVYLNPQPQIQYQSPNRCQSNGQVRRCGRA